MAVAVDLLRWHVRLEPGRGHHGQAVERGVHRLADTLYALEGADRGQHVGGVGALTASRLEQLARDAVLQQCIEQQMLRTPGDEATAELREDSVVKALIGQLQAEQVLHVDASTYGVGSLATSEVLGELEDQHEGEAPGRFCGLPLHWEESGESLV